jgi:hypothetical protein
MNLAEKAFNKIFPDKEEKRVMKLKYSGSFSDYNANVKYNSYEIVFSLSKKWKKINENIVIGLIQELMLKLYNSKKSTHNMDLYNNFIRNMSEFARKNQDIDPSLRESFERVNDKYFNGLISIPNLKWGNHSFNILGSYKYSTDTIVITKVLKNNLNLLDYVMYHELLHKKIKFYSKNGRSYHHNKNFREKEKKFENSAEIEKQLESFLKKEKFKHRIKKGFGF